MATPLLSPTTGDTLSPPVADHSTRLLAVNKAMHMS